MSASYMEFAFESSGRCTYGLWMQNSYGVSQWTTGEDPYYVHGNTVTIGTGSESLDVYFDEKSHELYLRGTSKTDYGEVLVYIYADGGRLEGSWENGKMVGPGVIYFPNGDVIEADFTDGTSQTGKGKFTYANGCVYEGDLVDGVPEGEGKKVWPNGATYTGQWHKGAMSGQGEYVFENGARYKGSWANGRYNGEGTYTTSTGKVTHAIYKNGKVEKVIED